MGVPNMAQPAVQQCGMVVLCGLALEEVPGVANSSVTTRGPLGVHTMVVTPAAVDDIVSMPSAEAATNE